MAKHAIRVNLSTILVFFSSVNWAFIVLSTRSTVNRMHICACTRVNTKIEKLSLLCVLHVFFCSCSFSMNRFSRYETLKQKTSLNIIKFTLTNIFPFVPSKMTNVFLSHWQNILEKFNPGARQLISAGKAYLKALHGKWAMNKLLKMIEHTKCHTIQQHNADEWKRRIEFDWPIPTIQIQMKWK